MNEKEKIVLIFLTAFFILGSLISYFNGKRKNTILKEEIVKQEIKEDRKVTKKKININEASQKELISLPGIGEKIAQRII
ncbi:MAG: helix-hairpin-helix domain-containing protein, partial [candidate division WOR-3 bacterium]